MKNNINDNEYKRIGFPKTIVKSNKFNCSIG